MFEHEISKESEAVPGVWICVCDQLEESHINMAIFDQACSPTLEKNYIGFSQFSLRVSISQIIAKK